MIKSEQQLVIFARAPRIGNGKTRLAKDIGQEAAYEFYQNCLSSLLQECSNSAWKIVVAVASDEDSTHSIFQPYNVITQINGNLGQRMAHELSKNQSNHTIIIGSDIPQIRKNHLSGAFETLQSHDMVFGPAADGGFWLVGCRHQFELPQSFMGNVRWSTQHTLSDTLSTIPKNVAVAQVDTLRDVDDANSYYSQTGVTRL